MISLSQIVFEFSLRYSLDEQVLKFVNVDFIMCFCSALMVKMAIFSQARAGRSVVQSSSSGNLLQTLLYPLMFIWNFLYSMFFGAGVSSSSSSSQQRGEPMDQSSAQTNRPSSYVHLSYDVAVIQWIYHVIKIICPHV